ncbi:CD151 antigen-like isoform X1 [Chelonus insularis]|uniref:CD151 antigen-like isoform X1 n=2 Tax=Chelonus insularis TaxID=460826 RepID=UPI00158BC3E9|nr:CD151 antigen-like isoform X1 [Chelonus insularis]
MFKNMRRGEKPTDEETETEIDEEITESEESAAASKKLQFLGIPLYKLSYKRLPKKCLKVSFLAINSAIFLAGIAVVVISMWMLSDSKLMLRLTAQKLFVTILLIIGIFSATLAFLGIVAFIKQNRKLLVVYIICHSVLLCIIFICSVMSASFFDRITSKIRDDMKSTIMKYHLLDWVTEAWDNTQQYLQCCGIKSYKDWEEYLIDIPKSCCSKTIDQCLHMTEFVAYESGCLKSTYFMLKSHIDTVTISTLFISITSGISLFLAIGIKKRFKILHSMDI